MGLPWVASIFVVRKNTLGTLGGGAMRSETILNVLFDLGKVHLIEVTNKHFPNAPVQDHSRFETAQTALAPNWPVLFGKRFRLRYIIRRMRHIRRTRQPRFRTGVTDAIEKVLADTSGPVLCVLRYAEMHSAAGLANLSPADRARLTVWVDLDDREDRAQYELMQTHSSAFMRLLAKPVAQKYERLFDAAACSVDLVSFAAEDDLDGFSPQANVVTLPNTVATPAMFVPAPKTPPRLVFVGTLSFEPNFNALHWFLSTCWPALRQAHRDIEIDLVVSGPDEYPDQLKAMFDDLGGLNWHRNCPDLAPFYEKSAIAIAPVFEGSGSKIKVIEAASYGRPCVVRSHSARGLTPALREYLKITDDPKAFVQHILDLIAAPDQAEQIGLAMRNAQQKDHSQTGFAEKAHACLSALAPNPPNDNIAL